MFDKERKQVLRAYFFLVFFAIIHPASAQQFNMGTFNTDPAPIMPPSASNSTRGTACELRGQYVARLGTADHFNSSGKRLTNAAAVIRQDRANFFVYGQADPEDQSDGFFQMKQNREILENLLNSASAPPGTLAEIVNGTPLVLVSVCGRNGADVIQVSIISTTQCRLKESYLARLGPADHFNSDGERLKDAAAVVRQDRANYYAFGRRDPEDQGDLYFSSKENRQALENLINAGQSTPDALKQVVNGTPLILVNICQLGARDFVNVTILGN
jgi:hypothetical protein